MSALESNVDDCHEPASSECSAFLNWDENELKTEHEQAIIFRSLVATVKLQPTLDVSLEDKAVKFLKYVEPRSPKSADTFLSSLGRDTDESSANFVQSIGVLISTPSQVIIKASMEMLEHLIFDVPPKVQISLVKANLIPQLITTLNPQSLSFTESADIHTYLVGFIARTVKLATQFNLNQLTIEDAYEPQSVPETVLKQVLVPSGPYIWHLCVNRLSIIDGHPSERFLELLAHLLQISPYYQPTMDFVLHMRVLLTIPSCLTIFESESSNWAFLGVAIGALWIWKIKSGEVRQRWKTMYQMLRMEGFDDVIDEKLRNDKNAHFGSWIVATSIQWNNLVGMNIPQRR